MRHLVLTLAHNLLTAAAVLFAAPSAWPEQAVQIREQLSPGYQYHVSTRTEIKGSMTLLSDKPGQTPKKLSVTGSSSIEYDERVLTLVEKDHVQKTARIYRRLDFDRKVGDRAQSNSLRPAVRRLVILRHQQMEVPYSPDGPLTWGELDLVRTDVFTPALSGLFPKNAVSVGNRWTASPAAVQELTDLERIEDGSVECRFEEITTLERRRHARIGFSGTVRGVNEDGPNRQRLEGYYFFDLESAHLSYLYLKGVSTLLDKKGETLGEVEGQFVMTRYAQSSRDLADDALRSVALEPNADNTLLLFDEADVGVRFLHSRRWRISNAGGQTITLDETNGSGLLITLEPTSRTPTGTQYQNEVADWLKQQKATVHRTDSVQRISTGADSIERFTADVEIGQKRDILEYYVVRQGNGGATFAARLSPAEASTLRGEVERIVRSLKINRPITAAPAKPK